MKRPGGHGTMRGSALRGARGARLLSAAVLTFVLAISGVRGQESGTYGHYQVLDTDLLPRSEFASRRDRVVAQLSDSELMLVTSVGPATRSNDIEYPYRQRNSLLYLSGVTEHPAALLLSGNPVSIDGRQVHQVLFVARRDPARETWTGITMGVERAPEITGVATVLPIARLRGVLDTLLAKSSAVYYDGWDDDEAIADPLTGASVDPVAAFVDTLRMRFPSVRPHPAGEILDPMRVIKSPAEIALMRRADSITVEAHRATMRAARPGMHEYELEAIMEYTFRRLGSEDPGYESIVGSGPYSCILHYSTNRRKTEPGDLVVMDCGAELHGYSADVTRTIPISGHFSPEQRKIYDLVLAAQTAGIQLCRPGHKFWDPHVAAAAVISDGLMRLGIISSPEQARTYTIHGFSHFLGLDVHDVGKPGVLRSGMVLTVEPGIYIPAGSDCDPKWWNIGVRIEDDIEVTDNGPVDLSGDLERSADDIERIMAEGS